MFVDAPSCDQSHEKKSGQQTTHVDKSAVAKCAQIRLLLVYRLHVPKPVSLISWAFVNSHPRLPQEGRRASISIPFIRHTCNAYDNIILANETGYFYGYFFLLFLCLSNAMSC